MTELIKNEVITSVDKFSTATLNDLEKQKLLNRYDVKFIFSTQKLTEFIDSLQRDFRALDIKGERMFHYETIYYDTDDNLLFMHHHNGKLNRSKVRIRKYSSSPKTFVEVKFKSNNMKVYKSRLQQLDNELLFDNYDVKRLLEKYNLEDKELKQKITVTYDRMTFIHKWHPIKITLDANIYYKNCISEGGLKGLVIVECKSNNRLSVSNFIKHMKYLRIHELGVSKYCLGRILLDSDLKQNRFKHKLLSINKIIGQHNGSTALFRI
jgi:hypothetical protein